MIVPYGKQQALGVVLALTETQPPVETRPVLERVRSDGPLLPPLQLALAAHIASHYLAPPAMVVRQMLPPGMLERLELVARVAPGTTVTDGDGALLGAVAAAGERGVPARTLATGGTTRVAALRALREEAARGRVSLDWVLRPPSARERMERRAWLTDGGRAAVDALARGDVPDGRPLGRRQRELLVDLAADAPEGEGRPTGPLSATHGGGTIATLARRDLVRLETVRRPRRPYADRAARPGARPESAPLSAAQASAVQAVGGAIAERRHRAFLVEGVTASGKTALYTALIAAALAAGRGAILLVPEIALAAPILDRLRADLGVEVAVLHSGLGEGERGDEWRRLRAGEVNVVAGTRISVLAPLADIGVVIVDEEHDAAYKSDRTPRYQARDVAVQLGRLAECPVVLGSATPEVATVGRARAGELEWLRLPERVSGAAPRVELVDLREELATGNRSLLSTRLQDALSGLDTDAGERAILVLNRRGSASVVLCRDCGYVQICPECQRPLVYHATTVALRCHHCGATAPVARRCPACASPRIRYLGGGTERVERELRQAFPSFRVGRLDRDVVERKGAAERVVDAFTDGELDVLVGTSLVAKGLDVPEVTLVGVVSADVALNLPDERAAERTYQFLVQAVGRAGRGERPGLAIIQTYQPEHPAIVAVTENAPAEFYDAELEMRRRFRAPPFGATLKLTCSLEDRDAAIAAADALAKRLRERAADRGDGSAVLGPAPAYVARRAGRWRFHVIVRGPDPAAVLGADPGVPWSIDVDPESLL